MKETIKIKDGKTLELPTRMYTKNELKKMGIPFVNNKIYFNRCPSKGIFEEIPVEVKDNMAVINYHDLSGTSFKNVDEFIKALKDSVKKQESNDSNFIILPVCKNEGIDIDGDVYLRKKFELAEELGLEHNKDIIVEMHYKSNISNYELSKLSKGTDILSIFFGVPYGHYPSFKKLVKKICSFKNLTNKRVMCMGIPMKFSGDDKKEVYFMPCFDIISDMWSRCWRRGGGPREIKVVDQNDFRSKNEIGWLNSGYEHDYFLISIDRTVRELFLPENKELREEFESYILDEAMREIARLNPLTIDGFVGRKFDEKYVRLILTAYREKLISGFFRTAKSLLTYNDQERKMLENRIRMNHFEPLAVWWVINKIVTVLQNQSDIKVNELIKEIDKFEFDL